MTKGLQLRLALGGRGLHFYVDPRYAQPLLGVVPDLKSGNKISVLRRLQLGELASVRADMIRAPTAIPVFTIRSFEPLGDKKPGISTIPKRGKVNSFLTGLRGRGVCSP